MTLFIKKNKNAIVVGIIMLLIGGMGGFVAKVYSVSQVPYRVEKLEARADTAKAEIIRLQYTKASKIELINHEAEGRTTYARKDVMESQYKGLNEKMDLVIKLLNK